jgi:hypothetical protein
VVSDRGPAALTEQARGRWESLSGGGAFAPVPRVAVSPRSRMCPPGWVGLVVIGDRVLITAPDQAVADLVQGALGDVVAAAVTSAEVLSRRLPVAELRGPASLAYLDPAEFCPAPGHGIARPLDPGQPGFRQFLRAASPEDREESGIEEITSPAFTVQERGQVVAAAGYRDWPEQTAHLSVLTAPAARGRGLARIRLGAANVGTQRPGAQVRPGLTGHGE